MRHKIVSPDLKKPILTKRNVRSRCRPPRGFTSAAKCLMPSIVSVTCLFVLSMVAAADSRLTVPPGFEVSVFAADVPNARQITAGGDGLYYVGSRRAGVVYAVVDKDNDFVAEEVVIIARDLYMPSGVAYRDRTLFVAEVDRIIAFDDINDRYRESPVPRTVYDKLPSDAHHGWKSIEFGPDGALYIPVGAPCNVCQVADPHGTILRLNIDTQESTVVARGVRNSVGLAWHPVSGELWFSDNGRDMLGDDLPPGEINRLRTEGAHFGFPFRHGGQVDDPQFGTQGDGHSFTPPAIELGAHVAPLGITFYTGSRFPAEYRHNLFVAEHGSWNRSRKAGYRVMRASFDAAGELLAYQPFISGWLIGESHWGRPVDFEQLADGSLLVTDDHSGVVYRVTYRGEHAD